MHWHIKIQMEDLINVLKVVLLLFHQSSGHTEKREDGFNANNMNCEHDCWRVLNMHWTVLNADCLGVNNPLLQAGAMQELDCKPEDRPIYLNVDKQMGQ